MKGVCTLCGKFGRMVRHHVTKNENNGRLSKMPRRFYILDGLFERESTLPPIEFETFVNGIRAGMLLSEAKELREIVENP